MSKIGYKELSAHYNEMLDLFDMVHFSSGVPESMYRKYTNIKESKIIPITNNNVGDNRQKRSFDSTCLSMIFIGSTKTYKGFLMLEQVLSELYDEGFRDWSLDVWGGVGESACDLIRYNGEYKAEDLGRIYSEDKLLVTPSLWCETFSLVTLEALSYATPVLVSSTVGAKDIIAEYDHWFIFQDRSDLKAKLLELLADRSRLRSFNSAILAGEWNHSMADHAEEIMELYR